MKGVHFHQIPPPRNCLSLGREYQTRHVHDWAVGHVLSGNPFRVVEGECAGMHRYLHLDMENFLRRLRCVHIQPNWVVRRLRAQ